MSYAPATIQAYFTRPDRLVNPARIQEVKNGSTRSKGILAATDNEVGEFLDTYAANNTNSNLFAPPIQDELVSQFGFGANGKIYLIPESEHLEEISPETKDVYDELRTKSIAFCALGHNSLGGLYEESQEFRDAIKDNPEEASLIKIFMKGNGLRSKLRSFQASLENPDLYPTVQIDAAVVPIFEDLLDAFSLLVNFTPQMANLENNLGKEGDFEQQGETLQVIQPAVRNASDVADEDAVDTITDQLDDGLSADNDNFGHIQRSVAFSSIRNFSIAVFSPLFRAARYVFGDDNMPSVVLSVRNALAAQASTDFYVYVQAHMPLIVRFIQEHSETFRLYAERIVTNPKLQEFITHIVNIITAFM